MSWLFGHVDKRHNLGNKQTTAVHILPNFSRRKGNQIMKFGQLIEYNIRKFFLEKSYTKCGGETIPLTLF